MRFGCAVVAPRPLVGISPAARVLTVDLLSGICSYWYHLASARVLAKLGMTYEGRLRHTQLIRDGWRDSDTYSILEDEWRAGCLGHP